MNVIISPVITEKSMNEAAKGKFTFKVAKQAEKDQIRGVIERRFKVNVISIATLIVKGKVKRTGQKRMIDRTSDYKKAIVTLKAGQKIDLFEVGGQGK
jgi:large subunit ribosomal protein L23